MSRSNAVRAGVGPLVAAMVWVAVALGVGPHAAAQGHAEHGTGPVDSGNITPQASWTHTFDTAQDFSYLCHPHPFMKGKIVVSDTDPQARTGMVDVRIRNYTFEPSGLIVKPGTMVRWTNLDAVVHTVTQEETDREFTILGLPWWQALLAAAALIAGGLLIFIRPRRKKEA